MDTLPERLNYLWFLGYGLDDDVPHHSVLSKAPRRWGCEVFEMLFSRPLFAVFSCREFRLYVAFK